MEISQICSDLIRILNSGNNTVRDLKDKTDRINSFCRNLEKTQMREDFIKSSYIQDVIKAVLEMSAFASKRSSFQYQRFEEVINFFSFLSRNKIPLAKEEKDIQELIKTVIDIIILVSKADEDSWLFWIKVFTEMLKIPTFFNLFRGETEGEDDNDISYIDLDNLFLLINQLMKFSKISNREFYQEQRLAALDFFSTFLQYSPYPPSPDIINSVFEFSNIPESTVNITDQEFKNLLNILNELIALSPISFLINSATPFHSPFNQKIVQTIFDRWDTFQADSSLRKASSAYLLLFLTTMDALEYKIEQSVYENWTKRILNVWSKCQKRDKLFKSNEDIPYFRADIEFLRRSNDASISECLLQFILQNENINPNSSVIWLFTGIGLYAPNIVHQKHWLKILKSIASFRINAAVWRNQQLLLDFYSLISVMCDIIDSKTEWNHVFSFLIENQPSAEPVSSFYSLISKILSKQKIDTQVAHNFQLLFWKGRSNSTEFTIERLQCIHTFIYYYGFADSSSRASCFDSLISLLDSEKSLPNEYLKQLALTICSVISSHPCHLVPIKAHEEKGETIDDICNKLKKQLEITTAKKKVDSPLQTEELFMITPDSSQITVDDDNDSTFDKDDFPTDSQDDKSSENNQEEAEVQQSAICNFISKEDQINFVKCILHRYIKNESNDCFFKLFITSLMPNFFSPNDFFEDFKSSFEQNCNVDNYPSFIRILSTVADEIQAEDFQPFFEEIETFFDITRNYIHICDEKVQEFIQESASVSWELLSNIVNENYYGDLLLLSEFAVKCSRLAVGTNDHFYECFEDFLSTSVWVPILHLQICSNLLKLSLSDQQKAEIISSLENITIRVLQVLLVPVKEREIFIQELFNALTYDNCKPMDDLFRSISKYSITPTMKLGLLNIMQNNFRKANQIFDCFWESGIYSPFFIQDDYPMIRLQSIDTIISILKLKDFVFGEGEEMSIRKFDKDIFFKDFISPSLEEMLSEVEWSKSKQTIFTALKTLISIAAEIPELSKKALFIIFESLTLHDRSIFPDQCINVMFSGLSSRIHFSVFLRQFMPMMVPQIEKLIDNLDKYPFDLFFLDENRVTKNEAKRLFCDKAAPFVIAYSFANSKQEIIDFFSKSLKKQPKEIIKENLSYICSYLLDAIEESPVDDQDTLQKLYNQLMTNNKFHSPIPLLSFVSMASEDAITSAYNNILENKTYNKEFTDIRNFIFRLYTNIFKAHHELVQSYYLQQFTLYVSILFQLHKSDFEVIPTLYSDVLALAVNLLEFVPPSESSHLLNAISSNIPDSFHYKMIGFVKNIEDICINLGYHQCLDNFFEKFPKLINKIMIFDFLKDRQIESRNPRMEFKRIAKTKRLNHESINFLLYNFINNPETFEPIYLLENDLKRTVLYEVYKFSVSNPQTLALQLYSKMFLKFIHIHPSPLIIGCDINSPESLFIKIIELARDKNPSISRSALTALHLLISNSSISLPVQVASNNFLKSQLEQYKLYARPRTKIKKPESDAPWICSYMHKYIEQMNESDLCYSFISLVASSAEFCKQLFPHFFIECLRKDDLYVQVYSDFKKFAEDPKKYVEECKLFISAFNYLRGILFSTQHQKEQGWNYNWANRQFDFKLIMEVCLSIGDPYSAYQYAEFAHEVFNMEDEPLGRIFTNIGVNELKYGLNHDFSNPSSVAELHSQEGRLGKSLILYDNGNNVDMISDTLRKLHLYNMLNGMKIKLTEKNIEAFWRLRKWDVSSEIMREMNNKDHSTGLFAVMQAFATNNEEAIKQKLNEFTQQFRFELGSSVFTQLSNLLDASALNWFQAVVCPKSSVLFSFFPQTIIDFYRHSLDELNDLSLQFYKITESANALNGVFFCILNEFDNSPLSFPGIPPKFFADVISNALENKEIESAQYFISLFHASEKKLSQLANFEQIRVLYSDNPYQAVSLLERNYNQIILKEGELDSDKRRNVFNLRVEFARASWSAHTNYLPSDQIFEQLQSVIEKCESIKANELMADALFTLARIYHQQHREICNYFLTPEYKAINEIVAYEDSVVKHRSYQMKNIIKIHKHDLNNYMNMINNNKIRFSNTIVKSIENYMLTLEHTNKYDLESTFSIVGLWFDYTYAKNELFQQEVPDLISTMQEIFPRIDPVKFTPLFYQLAAHIDSEGEITSSQTTEYNSEFQVFLKEMITSICQKCPNECFPILFALDNTSKGSGRGGAIVDLIVSITSISSELHENWRQMQLLLQSYNLLSAAPQMKSSSSYQYLSQLNKGMMELTTDKMKYLTIFTHPGDVGIQEYYDKIQVLKGVNKPLLLKLKGTDGKIYKQIVKGDKDELRQDAVMQQLFVLSSKLLSKKNPLLSIRHYKVIPISQRSGVIQFVDNSISINNYLGDNELANYMKYNGTDNYNLFRGIVNSYNKTSDAYFKNPKKDESEKKKIYQIFLNIKKKIRPIFHYFFIERFPNPADWFVSRSRYCRHTATNSIVGHILGIGDRHLSNIMIDKKTAEVIHIDLGIAFDQGKTLPIPERVPFRLTTEIIDGMGWNGKEGIFRKTCEESMKVLRNSSEYLLTVLNVFLSDPLYNWKIVSNAASNAASGLSSISNPQKKNKFAESVIMNCRRKLEGRETGEKLSVEGQISKLIIDATNDEYLAMMYIGWRAYM